MVATTQERLASAFRLAQEMAIADTGEALERPDIAFQALVEAMATLKGLPDPESGWLYSQSFWPQIVHDHEGQVENYREMLRRIASGEESVDVLLKRRPPSSAEIGRMEAIFEVYPSCLVGKSRSRDWKILCFLAAGHTTRAVAKLAGTSRETASDRRGVQSRQIAMRLDHLMPAVSAAIAAPVRPIYRMDRNA